jgi:hypothetical protein
VWETELMNENDKIVVLLEDIQRTLKEQVEMSTFRWRVVVGAAIVSLIIGMPAILSYLHLLLVRIF